MATPAARSAARYRQAARLLALLPMKVLEYLSLDLVATACLGLRAYPPWPQIIPRCQAPSIPELTRALNRHYPRLGIRDGPTWTRIRRMTTAHAIAVAILLCQPSIGQVRASSYASLLVSEAGRHRFDPMVAVALVCHESRWRPGAVSADGEDYGLGQLRARFMGGCVGDADPVFHPSEKCRAAKVALLDPANNLRLMAEHIGKWQQICRLKTGRRASAHHWLAAYAGLSSPSKGVWCGQSNRLKAGKWVDLPRHKVVSEVLQFRKLLSIGLPPPRQLK